LKDNILASAGRYCGSKVISTVLSGAILWLIRFYRYFISPVMPGECRFYPTCSKYALEAVEKHGAVRGSIISVMRIMKCHPWHPGGYDPVP
jgi:putative membrane protein insertion efficiency factor